MSLFWLVLGLIVFLGGHLVTRQRGLRAQLQAHFGPKTYQMLYSLVAVLGFALIVHGFASYRAAGLIPVWTPPRFLVHPAMLLILLAMILLIATYAGGRIKAMAKHPMLAAVKLWAFAHLLVNGDLGSILLFGSFLAWAVYTRIAIKRAGPSEAGPIAALPGLGTLGDIISMVGGMVLTFLFIKVLHLKLIGVAVM